MSGISGIITAGELFLDNLIPVYLPVCLTVDLQKFQFFVCKEEIVPY